MLKQEEIQLYLTPYFFFKNYEFILKNINIYLFI